jgi:hypothetical protein
VSKKITEILKRLVLFALLILTVTFSSYSGLLSLLKVDATTPQAVSNPLLQQQQQQQLHQPQTQLPAITSLPRSPTLESNTAASIPQSLQSTIITSAVDGNNSPIENGGTTTSNSITFTFAFVGARGTTNNNPAVVTPGETSGGTTTATSIADFQCSLDNALPASCISPTTIHNLATGHHIFQVRAIDTAGNKEPTGASFSWTVAVGAGGSTRSNGLTVQSLLPLINSPVTTPRAVPPNAAVSVPPLLQGTTIITSAVDGDNSPVQNGGTTTSNSITFTFAFGVTIGGTAPANTGISGFQCTLDNSPTASYCSTPAAIHNLAAGNHVFQVRAIDIAGSKEPTEARFSWTILAPSSSSSTSFSSQSEQSTGTATPVPSIPPSYTRSSGSTSTGDNPSSPTIKNNTTAANVTTIPLVHSSTTAIIPRSSSSGGTNAAATTPSADNNITTVKAASTTKSNLTPKAGSKVLGGWSGYAGLGGCIIGNPATGQTVDSTNSGREQVFVVGCDHALHYNTQDSSGAWSGFTSLGGYVISNPVLGFNTGFQGNLLEAFVVGNDHALYYNLEYGLGGWSGFTRLGGYIIGDPAAGFTRDSAGNFHAELVVVGSDHALYLNRQDSSGAWSGFTRLGGYVISNPALARTADTERLQIFVIGNDHALYTTAETATGSGSYSGFARIGGYIIGNPAVGVQLNQLLTIFVVGGNNAMFVSRELTSTGTGTWNGFENLGGPSIISNPVVSHDNFGQVNDGSNQINVFVIGSDHSVYHLTQVGANNDSWAFENLGGYVIGDPGTGWFVSTTLNKDVFELFVVGSDKALYYKQNPTFCGCG